jgi:hypothetical protein
LKDEIEEAIPKRTKALERWINSALDDVFLVTVKPEETIGK